MTLCPELYRLLQIAFGEVKITHEGEEMNFTKQLYFDKDGEQRIGLNVIDRGETYRICCPFCSDQNSKKFRCWINYKWGREDLVTGTRNLNLVHCFNENCFAERENRYQLYRIVFQDGRWKGMKLELNSGIIKSKRQPLLPGPVLTLDRLQDDHYSKIYLRNRGYDPNGLGKHLGVGYCAEAVEEFHYASNRIVIPMLMDNKLIGWQARYIGDPDWRKFRVLKYYTMPDMDRAHFLYNYDNARISPYVILTEGVTDVWSVGKPCVATLGKTISRGQKDKIIQTWGKGLVMIYLDPDAEADALALYDDLKPHVNSVLIVKSSDGFDPGANTPDKCWNDILASCKSSGVDLPSFKPNIQRESDAHPQPSGISGSDPAGGQGHSRRNRHTR